MYYKSLVFVFLAFLMIPVQRTESADSKSKNTLLTSPDPSEIALADGIIFSNPDYPSFLENVSGMSGREAWGRWSDGKEVVFTFKKSLPAKFDLVLKASVISSNENKSIPFKVGKWSGSLNMPAGSIDNAKEYRLHVNNSTKSKEIRITIPNPVQPGTTDTRYLGIAFITMKIIAANQLLN